MSLQSVKAFYERLATDEAFRTQLQNVKDKAECSQFVKSAGYDFTSEEFEEYTAQMLESSSGNDEMTDLNEKELEAVFGGASPLPLIRFTLPSPIQTYGHPPVNYL